MDTSIIYIIQNTCIVQHKASKNIYLINNWCWHLIAHYKNWKWESATWETQLVIDMDLIDNQTDSDKIDNSDWIIIAW